MKPVSGKCRRLLNRRSPTPRPCAVRHRRSWLGRTDLNDAGDRLAETVSEKKAEQAALLAEKDDRPAGRGGAAPRAGGHGRRPRRPRPAGRTRFRADNETGGGRHRRSARPVWTNLPAADVCPAAAAGAAGPGQAGAGGPARAVQPARAVSSTRRCWTLRRRRAASSGSWRAAPWRKSSCWTSCGSTTS